jgi:hypothetical protein
MNRRLDTDMVPLAWPAETVVLPLVGNTSR